MKTPEIPHVVVPFPPEITPEEVISRRSRKKLKSRPPNRFFIYRIAYLKQLKDLAHIDKISMTKVSPYISKSWYAEPIEIREEYRRLADQVGELLKAARRESFVLVCENPEPMPTPSVEPEPSLSEQEIHYLFNLYFGI